MFDKISQLRIVDGYSGHDLALLNKTVLMLLFEISHKGLEVEWRPGMERFSGKFFFSQKKIKRSGLSAVPLPAGFDYGKDCQLFLKIMVYFQQLDANDIFFPGEGSKGEIH